MNGTNSQKPFMQSLWPSRAGPPLGKARVANLNKLSRNQGWGGFLGDCTSPGAKRSRMAFLEPALGGQTLSTHKTPQSQGQRPNTKRFI